MSNLFVMKINPGYIQIELSLKQICNWITIMHFNDLKYIYLRAFDLSSNKNLVKVCIRNGCDLH